MQCPARLLLQETRRGDRCSNASLPKQFATRSRRRLNKTHGDLEFLLAPPISPPLRFPNFKAELKHMQKTCRLKEKKTCHSVTGRLTQGRGPAPAVGPGSEDGARPRPRGLSQTPAPTPVPVPAPRQRSAAPCWPRPAPQALFVPSAEKNQTQPFIYLWRVFLGGGCGLFGFGFFSFFPPALKSDFGIFLRSFASPAFVPSASGKRCGGPGETRPHLRGARFAFPPSRFFFQHCGLLRMLSRNMRSCALHKKKKKKKGR